MIQSYVLDRPSNKEGLDPKMRRTKHPDLVPSCPIRRKALRSPASSETIAMLPASFAGETKQSTLLLRLNLGIKLWPTEERHSIGVPLSQRPYDALSVCQRKREIEVIVWAKYCPPVDTAQLLPTPLSVLSVPSYIKAITSSKG